VEISRLSAAEINDSSFALEISNLQADTSYQIDFFADANGNGSYDAPPENHAWLIDLMNVQSNDSLTFSHNTRFTDIGWLPAIDGIIEVDEYANSMLGAATGMSVFWYNTNSLLYIGLASPGAVWLSIGFEPARQMLGANILQAAGAEVTGRSVHEFVVSLDSGDDQDKALMHGTEVVVILAYHASSDSLSGRRSKRSTTTIELDD
jgi:hypothetical protein